MKPSRTSREGVKNLTAYDVQISHNQYCDMLGGAFRAAAITE